MRARTPIATWPPNPLHATTTRGRDDEPGLLLIGGVTDRMMDRLTAEFTVHPLFDQEDREGWLRANGEGIVAVATDGHYGLNPAPMEHLPNLKVVSSYGVGYDGIDADGAAARGIIVAHTPDVLNDEVADTAVMLWLAASRRLVGADAWARSGDWEARGAFPPDPKRTEPHGRHSGLRTDRADHCRACRDVQCNGSVSRAL